MGPDFWMLSWCGESGREIVCDIGGFSRVRENTQSVVLPRAQVRCASSVFSDLLRHEILTTDGNAKASDKAAVPCSHPVEGSRHSGVISEDRATDGAGRYISADAHL